MAYNIPGMFKLVQGVPPRTPRYGPVAPRPSAMQGFLDGGMYNIPGYDHAPDHREIMTPEEWVGSDSLSDDGGMLPAETATGESVFIRQLIGMGYADTIEDAKAQWEDMSEDQRAVIRRAFFGEDPSGGGGDGLAGTYAQIAENARQFNEQMAFERERAKQEDAVARWGAEMQRQQAMSDFTQARDAAKVARKSMFNDAASGALAAQQSAMGTANIPGIENWRMDGGAESDAIIGNAPIIRTDPSLAYGQQLAEPADLYEPNIPGVTF